MRPAVLLAGAALALVTVTPTTVSADIGGLGVAPAHYDPSNPATRSYFIRSVAPGGGFSDAVAVSNSGPTPLLLNVYPVDGFTAVTAGAVFANQGSPVIKWAGWLTPGVSSVSVGPGSTIDVPFTVNVPSNAAPGDHLAGIAFQDAQPSSGGGTGAVQVHTVFRAVVGVLVQVPGSAAFHVCLGGTATQATGNPSVPTNVLVYIGDDGGLLGKPSVTVHVTGPGGYNVSQTRTLDTLLPGDEIPYPFPWPDPLTSSDSVAVTASAPGMTPPGVCPSTVSLPPGAASSVPPSGGTPAGGTPTPGHHGAGVQSPRGSGSGGADAPSAEGFLSYLPKLLAQVVLKSTFPFLLGVLAFFFLILQDRIDRKDPKLALAPARPDPELTFPGPSGRAVA